MQGTEFPPPSPAPIDDTPPPSWGLGPTLGLGLLVMACTVLTQFFTVVLSAGVLIATGERPGHAPVSFDQLSQQIFANPLIISLPVLASAPVSICVLWVVIRKRPGRRFAEYLALRGFRPRQFFVWAAALAVVLFAGEGFLAWRGDHSGETFIRDLVRGGRFLVPLFAAVTLAAPIMEELLFRGFMFRGIAESRAGWIVAILIPNFMWVAMHAQYAWPTLVVLFAMGIVLGLARRFSGSVVLPVVLHILSNTVSTLTAMFMDGAPPS